MKQSSPTVYDIAAALGLSPATVSRCLNHPEQVKEETRVRVLAYASEHGFRKRLYHLSGDAGKAAPSPVPLETERSYLLCIPSSQNPFYSDIIDGAMSAALQHGCCLYVDYSSITARNIDDFIRRARQSCRGLILLHHLEPELLEALSAGIPVVQCSERSEGFPQISSVSIDDEASEEQAADYIISAGAREIAFMTTTTEYLFAENRRKGFLKAMSRAALPVQKERIWRVPQVEFLLACDAASRRLRQPDVPDGIVCVSDIFAAACIKAAHTIGLRVPQDLMVVGFDNISLAVTTTPSVTTISQPRYQLGFHAFEILYQEIHNTGQKKQHVVLPAELIIRDSTRRH